MARFTAFVVALLIAASGGSAQQQPPPTFRGESELVRVFATVMDRDGRLVTNLTQKQFEVRDEGKAQPISLFDNSPQPIRLIVMLDVSGSMQGNLPLLRAAGEQLIARLRQEDRARVGTFGDEVTLSPTFTRDRGELMNALPASIPPDAPTPLWRAVDAALDGFKIEDGTANAGNASMPDARPVILVLSDGKDSGPTSFRQRYVSQAEVIERARDEGVMIYGVAMRSRGPRQIQPGIGPGGLQAMLSADLPDPGLARVAEETGGGFLEIRFGQELGAAFASVADELHSQYLLGYPPPRRDGKVHDVEVRVTERGLKARARKNYLAPRQ